MSEILLWKKNYFSPCRFMPPIYSLAYKAIYTKSDNYQSFFLQIYQPIWPNDVKIFGEFWEFLF